MRGNSVGNFVEHVNHSMRKYPRIPIELHKKVHEWMDNPANWRIEEEFPFSPKREGYKNIIHNPKRVADALSSSWRDWGAIHVIAQAHVELDR